MHQPILAVIKKRKEPAHAPTTRVEVCLGRIREEAARVVKDWLKPNDTTARDGLLVAAAVLCDPRALNQTHGRALRNINQNLVT